MSIKFRVYAFDESDVLHRIGKELFGELQFGQSGIRELSNQNVRFAYVEIIFEADIPQEISRIIGERWAIDRHGFADTRTRNLLRDNLRQKIDLSAEPNDWEDDGDDAIVDLSSLFEEKTFNNRLSWQPTDREVTLIVHDLWPATAGKPVKIARYLSSSERSTKPLTHRAKIIVRELEKLTSSIHFELSHNKLNDLQSLVDHALNELNDPLEPGYEKIAGGILDAVMYEIARKKAWKSNKGTWYALAESYKKENLGHSFSTLEHVKCDGKKRAIKVARELIIKHADKFSDTFHVEVSLLPEIEWSAERGTPEGSENG